LGQTSVIQEAKQPIADYTAEMTFEAFLTDTNTQDAVIRNVNITGEATKNLSPEIRAIHPDLSWDRSGLLPLPPLFIWLAIHPSPDGAVRIHQNSPNRFLPRRNCFCHQV
jgi:hypothetical protein